jgi:Domain of unknown function (DUF6647)
MVKRITFCTFIVVLAMASPSVGQPSELVGTVALQRADRLPSEVLLTEIVAWLASNFHLQVTYDLPRIEFVPQTEMAVRRYRSLLLARPDSAMASSERMAQPEQMPQVVAFYNPQNKTIYLPDEWTAREANDLSVLVHEMVHHLQREAGINYKCPAEREKLAYEAQDKWLARFGRTLENEFEIDGLTRLVRTSCLLNMNVSP